METLGGQLLGAAIGGQLVGGFWMDNCLGRFWCLWSLCTDRCKRRLCMLWRVSNGLQLPGCLHHFVCIVRVVHEVLDDLVCKPRSRLNTVPSCMYNSPAQGLNHTPEISAHPSRQRSAG